MPTKYQATAPDGTVFKRTTAGRTYTHVVVRHYVAEPAKVGHWPARDAHWATGEWRRSKQLAEALAATYRGKMDGRLDQVLVLEAVEV